MSNINYNLYKIFCTVSTSKSYSDAGTKLSLTPANISAQILNLENQLGVKLFYREKDGVKLTGEGKELFEIINKSISSFDFAEKAIKEKNNLANGNIYIGCPSHLTTYYLMNYINKAKNEYPNLNIKLICGANPDEMVELMKNHKIDFAIIDMIPECNENLVVEVLKKVNNVFVSKEQLKINDIKELENFKYLLNFNYSIGTRKLFKLLDNYNVKIKNTMECDTTEIRVDAAKRGLGIAYVMKEAVKRELENQELYEVQVPITLPNININLIYMKDMLTQVDKKFIKKYLKSE